MSFIERAESMAQRGDFPRAAFMLANELLREPNHREALERLLDIYLLHIKAPGAERDILRVLEVQEDGYELYEFIEARLDAASDRKRIESLRRVREREGLLREPPPEEVFVSDVVQPTMAPQPGGLSVEPLADQNVEHDGHTSESGPAFIPRSDIAEPEVVNEQSARVPPQSTPQRHGTSADALPNQRSATATPTDARWHGFEEPRNDGHHNATDESGRESATTGMFSSIDLYVEEQQDVNQLLERRRKRRLLILFAAIVILLLLIVFVLPGSSQTEEASGDDSAAVEPRSHQETEPSEEGEDNGASADHQGINTAP